MLKAIEITVIQEAERERPGYNAGRPILSDLLPYLHVLPRVSRPAKLALHFSNMSRGVVWSISVSNQDSLYCDWFYFKCYVFRGFAKNSGMLEGQLCPVWVAERFPEELMVANEQGDVFLGKGLVSASCWDIGSSTM